MPSAPVSSRVTNRPNRVTPLIRPVNVAPNQPYPFKDVYPWTLGVLAATLLAGALLFLLSPRDKVLEHSFRVSPNETSTLYTPKFRLRGGRNIKLVLSTPQTGIDSSDSRSGV